MTNGDPLEGSERLIERLLDELYELRGSLREMSLRLARIENRIKHSFPRVVAPKELAAKQDRQTSGEPQTVKLPFSVT